MLFTGNNYWLASRCVATYSSYAYLNVCRVISSNMDANILCIDFSSSLNEYPINISAVRPLVSLKSEVIDIDAGYDETTGWKLK